MKKLSTFLMLALLLCATIPQIPAASDICQEVEVIHTEFGDIEVTTTTLIYDSAARSSSRSAERIFTAKQSGEIVAEVTLSATFGFDGQSSWVTNASASHATYNGWSYSGENISKTGGTASLTATLTHLLYRDIPVSLSLTCSATGQIS